MRSRFVTALVAFVVWVVPARAEGPQGKVVRDVWDAAYLEGAKTGFFHTTVHEVERDGQKFLRTSLEMDLQIKRYNATVRLRMITGTEETADGKVTAVAMTQFLDKGKQLVLTGAVKGGQLHVKVEDPPLDKKVPWNDEVIGMARQERLFQEKKAKPGDRIKYLSYEPSINAVVTVWAAVKDEEEVEVLKAKDKGKTVLVKEKLLRVEAVPDKVTAPNASIQLPGMTSWLDKELLPVRSEMELPGVGKVVLHRTTKEVATAENGQAAKVPDIGLTTLVPLNKTLAKPHETRSVVYKITVKGDDDPKSAFAEDERQKVQGVKGDTITLRVQAVRGPQPKKTAEQVKDEYLQSCYFLDSDNEEVKKKAGLAVGAEKDPWKKAQLIEAWVHRNIRKKNYNVAFATAGQVAQNLEGDCRQHAVLAAAMCRAAGVPSRTAVGLVYVLDQQGRPAMGFHMWAEVFVQGQWVALDATLGKGAIGAAHIKIADHSWHDTQSLTPLLPVARVLGKISIEVVNVNEGE